MGYTHYFTIDPIKCTSAQFLTFGQDTQKIYAAAEEAGIELAFECDEPDTPPSIGEGVIRFNGVGEEGHETFLLDFTPVVEPVAPRPSCLAPYAAADDAERELWWLWYEYDDCLARNGKRFAFCKTARKPYDQAVCAALIRAKVIFGAGISISSDGDWKEDADGNYLTWAEGRKLYKSIFGPLPRNPLT